MAVMPVVDKCLSAENSVMQERAAPKSATKVDFNVIHTNTESKIKRGAYVVAVKIINSNQCLQCTLLKN